jgi:hypothetical protein
MVRRGDRYGGLGLPGLPAQRDSPHPLQLANEEPTTRACPQDALPADGCGRGRAEVFRLDTVTRWLGSEITREYRMVRLEYYQEYSDGVSVIGHVVWPPRLAPTEVALLLTIEDAQNKLAPYHPIILESIEAAWREWTEKFAPSLPWPRRTLPACMHELIERELRTRLGSLPGIVLSDTDNDRFFIHLGDADVLLHVKKLDDRLRPRNYPTDGAIKFNGQEDLPAVPDAPRVTLGYRVSETRDQLVGVFVAFLKNDDLQWFYELTHGPDGGASIVPDYPSLPLAAPGLALKPGRHGKTGE